MKNDETISVTNSVNGVVNTQDITHTFESANDYYSFFKSKEMGIEDAISKLVSDNTDCSMYVLVQILGNPSVCQFFGWRSPEECDFKIYRNNSDKPFKSIYEFLFFAIRYGKLPMRGIGGVPICILTKEAFVVAFAKYKNMHHSNKPKKKKVPSQSFSHNTGGYKSKKPYGSSAGKYISDYVHGLTDL